MDSQKKIKQPSDIELLLLEQINELRARQLNLSDGKRSNNEYILISDAILRTTEMLMHYFTV